MQNKNQLPKKERLSLMTVKTLLVILLFTGMGVIIIGGGYIIVKYTITSPNKIDLPIIDPIIETQCEIDSECELVYTGSNICLPCDTSIEEYECLPSEEAKKIEEERFKKMVDKKIFCEQCLEKPQHTCKCVNVKCEKVKERLVEEVFITTDKTEYESGETLKITLINNSEKSIFSTAISLTPEFSIASIEKQETDKTWEKFSVRCVWPECDIDFDGPSELKVGQKAMFDWVPTVHINNKDMFLDRGVYRFAINYQAIKNQAWLQVYSNEFTIKEKSALDPRCEEKVVGIGSCKMGAIGYEFDSSLEKCVEKRVGGCSFEIPFGSLEECQEVCEKKENIALPDKEELIKCNNNSDCVLVNSGCCGCSMGGGMTCINKNYLENWNQKLKFDCKVERACLAVYLCDDNPTGCECVDNVCHGVKGWEEI